MLRMMLDAQGDDINADQCLPCLALGRQAPHRFASRAGALGLGEGSARLPVVADRQDLVVFQKFATGVRREVVCEVLYVSLRGQYGVPQDRQ
jgi:hypothetical protein